MKFRVTFVYPHLPDSLSSIAKKKKNQEREGKERRGKKAREKKFKKKKRFANGDEKNYAHIFSFSSLLNFFFKFF